jgi:hypothetical protein
MLWFTLVRQKPSIVFHFISVFVLMLFFFIVWAYWKWTHQRETSSTTGIWGGLFILTKFICLYCLFAPVPYRASINKLAPRSTSRSFVWTSCWLRQYWRPFFSVTITLSRSPFPTSNCVQSPPHPCTQAVSFCSVSTEHGCNYPIFIYRAWKGMVIEVWAWL